jgi:AcrR family transcriptional regulator
MNTKRSAKSRKRVYKSPLRQEQAAATRERIVEAFLAEVRSGASELSVPALARRARVSVPTVYRYFPTRTALFESVVGEIEKTMPGPPPSVSDDFRPNVRGFFVRQAQIREKYGAFADSALLWQMRREITVPRRRAYVEQITARILPELREPERTWFVDLVVVMVSSMMSGALAEYVGAVGDGAADRIEWALDALIAHAKKTKTKGRKK